MAQDPEVMANEVGHLALCFIAATDQAFPRARSDSIRLSFAAIGFGPCVLKLPKKLIATIGEAICRIDANPKAGLPAPSPCPEIARQGRFWMKVSRYWIVYIATSPPMITGVFFETANIPSRL